MEIQLLHCIRNPNIVEFYGNSLDGSCILIEYMRHGNLAKFADLDLRYVKPIMKQIMEAVKYLHDNKVVHGDLKPENALISE
jgi:serine/threonine protein kinase